MTNPTAAAAAMLMLLGGCLQPTSGTVGGDSDADATPDPTRRVVDVAAGWQDTCAVTDAGEVWCWGAAAYGATWAGTSPVRIAGFTDVVQVDVGLYPTGFCAVTGAGNVQCAVDQDNWPEPRVLHIAGVADAVEARLYTWFEGRLAIRHADGRVSDAMVETWWDTPAPPDPTAAAVPGIVHANSLAVGGPCAVTAGGGLICWGAYSPTSDGVAGPHPGFAGVTVASASFRGPGNRLLVIDAESDVWVWEPAFDGPMVDWASSPAPAITATSVDARVAGQSVNHACVATGSGVRCWGSNEFGELGVGFADDVAVASDETTVVSLDAVSLAVGLGHTCATDPDQALWCWGREDQLGLGRDDVLDVTRLRDVAGRYTLVAASVANTCAVDLSGAVWCWGSGADGQLGTGDGRSANVPAQGAVALDAVDVAMGGGSFACALTVSGLVTCWGDNQSGALAQGHAQTVVGAVTAKGLPPADAVVAGWGHACASSAGEVRCWGANHSGQVGAGLAAGSVLEPKVVRLPGPAAGLVAGSANTCAVVGASRELWCWGANTYGTIDDEPSDATTPRPSQLGDAVRLATVGEWCVCAVADAIACTGWAALHNQRLAEVDGDHVTAVGCHRDHVCYGLDSGDVACVRPDEAAARAALGAPVTGLALHHHLCVVTADGRLRCVGEDSSGQLGVGGGFVPRPTRVTLGQ